MNWLVSVGKWLRILDENGLVSPTNISMWIALYRLLSVPAPGFTEVGTFLLAATAYNVKKVISQ